MLAENLLRVVHPEGDPEDGLDEQAPEPGAGPGGGVLRAGLGRAAVEGEAVRVRDPRGDRQVCLRAGQADGGGHCAGCSGRGGGC